MRTEWHTALPAAPQHCLCLRRCLHALRVGWKLCTAKAEDEEQQQHMAFLSHDISMLRLFETFLENAPQLTLLLYVILRTNKAEPSQCEVLGPGQGRCRGTEWVWMEQIK